MTFLKKIFFLYPACKKLIKLMTRHQKVLLGGMVILTIFRSFVEAISISAIMPFITLVTDPSIVESGRFKMVYDFFGFQTIENFIIVLGIAIIAFYFFRGAFSLFHMYLMKRFSNAVYRHNSLKALNTTLFLPYKAFTMLNTGELMQSIRNETSEVGKALLHILRIFTELFATISIYIVLLLMNWRMTLTITAILLVIIVIMLSTMTKYISSKGKRRVLAGRRMTKIIKELLSNAKLVKLKGSEEEIIGEYDRKLKQQSKANLQFQVISATPKYILETVGFSFLIAVIIFIIYFHGDTSAAIPAISMYALALFRILPSVHRMISEINSLVFSEEAVKKVYQTIKQETEEDGNENINFERAIRLENVCFQYLTGKEVITNISIEIKKGEKIAFTGKSGSGKSTLIDIITGLHKPVSGTVYIDNTALTSQNIRSWRKKIGYIPQTVYLFDGTVGENVSFGSDYDEEKIKAALIKANIWDFLLEKDGIHSPVGDDGIKLSGGQQQRICIARALYDDPEVLVLDEATSALDNETEGKIMDEIYNASTGKTLIVIAHRLTTVERCDIKVCMKNGHIV